MTREAIERAVAELPESHEPLLLTFFRRASLAVVAAPALSRPR